MIIEQEAYRVPLCPYLTVGNGRVLAHLDAYCVPQSLHWPEPGSPDRLSWRDPADEWPYWDEMDAEATRARMPYFQYADGTRDYLHAATTVDVGYVEDTNVLTGRYVLPHGAVVETTTFVPPKSDVWVREYKVTGEGKFVHQSEFFEKAVRGHRGAYMGDVNFRGIFDGIPRGIYVIMSTLPLAHTQGRVEIDVAGKQDWSLYMCMASDLKKAVAIGKNALAQGTASLREETIAADRTWIAKARTPVRKHAFVQKHYKRWLLGNRLCLSDKGGMGAGPRPFWSFTWPRDSALNIGGFAAAGFIEEAQRLAKWNLDNTPESGIHEARYYPDGTPVLVDNRLRQGDNPGFMAWATAFVCQQQWDEAFARRIKDKLFVLADLMVHHVDEETLLPYPEADYMEGLPAISISIVASSIGGLLGAAYVAEKLGESKRAAQYRERAQVIKDAARKHMWNDKEKHFVWSIKPARKESDIIICLGAYPYRAWDADDEIIVQALQHVKLTRWNKTDPSAMWFYHKAIVLLGMAGIGDHETENEILAALERDVCPQGLIPEQLNRSTGHLGGCSYLTTSQGCMLLYAYCESAATGG